MAEFYGTEADLLDYQTGDDRKSTMIHEMNISFHIGYIIKDKIKHCDKLKDYRVDVEYNRHGNKSKDLNGKAVRPDILIHKRKVDDNNFAWLEVEKPGDNTVIEEDRERLCDATKKEGGEYRYDFGALIIVGKTPNDCKIEFYQDGELKCSLCLVNPQ